MVVYHWSASREACEDIKLGAPPLHPDTHPSNQPWERNPKFGGDVGSLVRAEGGRGAWTSSICTPIIRPMSKRNGSRPPSLPPLDWPGRRSVGRKGMKSRMSSAPPPHPNKHRNALPWREGRQTMCAFSVHFHLCLCFWFAADECLITRESIL